MRQLKNINLNLLKINKSYQKQRIILFKKNRSQKKILKDSLTNKYQS
jgi:hypothetical protein